jgi:Flp pilus assembly protein TadG
VLAAVCIPLVLGFVAMAADVGLLFRAKRNLQIAADAGAMNAAGELSVGDWSAAGKAGSAMNGVTDGVSNSTVVVNNPPVYGAYKGQTGYIEVIVSQLRPTFFMNVFGKSSMMVNARAVAQAVPSPTCVYTLGSASPGSSGPGGVFVTGSADLEIPTCGILDNATGANAVHVTGGATLKAQAIGIVGTDTVHIGGVLQPSSPVTGMTAMSDPLSFMTPPPPSDYSSGCATASITTNTTIGPASPSGYVCYSSLSTPRGSPVITLSPGLYIFSGAGGLNVSSGTTFSGTGVTFYFVNGASFTISNGATANLSAPTSGTYSGMLFYQDPTDAAPDEFSGGSAGNINGIFYLPAATLTMANGTATTFNTDLVVNSLTMSGAATLHPYAPLTGASPLSTPNLAE